MTVHKWFTIIRITNLSNNIYKCETNKTFFFFGGAKYITLCMDRPLLILNNITVINILFTKFFLRGLFTKFKMLYLQYIFIVTIAFLIKWFYICLQMLKLHSKPIV